MSIQNLTSVDQRRLGFMALSAGGWATQAGTATMDSANIQTYLHDAKIKSLAAQTNTALVALKDADKPVSTNLAAGAQFYLQPSGRTGFYTQPNGCTVYYVVVVTEAGAVRIVQGLYAGQPYIYNGVPTRAPAAAVVPPIPANVTPLAIYKIVTNGGAFTPGTTNWDGTGITATVDDFAASPVDTTPPVVQEDEGL